MPQTVSYTHLDVYKRQRKASLETTVDIANALGVSTDMLLQDSLDVMTKPLASDACLSEHSRALLTDIVGVLREHDVSRT